MTVFFWRRLNQFLPTRNSFNHYNSVYITLYVVYKKKNNKKINNIILKTLGKLSFYLLLSNKMDSLKIFQVMYGTC